MERCCGCEGEIMHDPEGASSKACTKGKELHGYKEGKSGGWECCNCAKKFENKADFAGDPCWNCKQAQTEESCCGCKIAIIHGAPAGPDKCCGGKELHGYSNSKKGGWECCNCAKRFEGKEFNFAQQACFGCKDRTG